MMGYNENFESWVSDGQAYDTYYIKFNDYDGIKDTWGDYLKEDNMVIVAVLSGGPAATALEGILEAALGTVLDDNTCVSTSSTTTIAPTTTTTTSHT